MRRNHGPALLVSLLGVALLLPTGATAEQESMGVYGELRGGVAFPDEDAFEVGPGVEAALGYGHETGLRGEFAFGYRHFDIDEDGPFGTSVDGDTSIFTMLFNGYYDLDLTRLGADSDWAHRLRPYGGFGLGLGIVDIEADFEVGGVPVGDVNETDTEFAWQLGLGTAYALRPNWALTAGWSYLEVDEGMHNLTFGIRHEF